MVYSRSKMRIKTLIGSVTRPRDGTERAFFLDIVDIVTAKRYAKSILRRDERKPVANAIIESST